MHELERAEFDLQVLALNGLRRGRTTGSCATAAVKAALTWMLCSGREQQVDVTLPDGRHYLRVPIAGLSDLDAATVRAEVLKDGGDDPDNTHGATIFAEVRRNALGTIRFFAGPGVGTATLPGLRVAVGEPAINPVPRKMMQQAVAEVLQDAGLPAGTGFDLTIGCENGEQIARKTFNPRLGILGGISILGTSGIVEPMSMASWVASIEVYVRVALAGDVPSVAYLPGKIGRDFARQVLELPDKRMVQIANFLGDALDFTQVALEEQQRQLDTLWLAGHPGKLAKVLDGVWDTHSSKSNMAMGSVARVAAERGLSAQLVKEMEQANTVEAVIEQMRHQHGAQAFWMDIEARIGAQVHARVPAVKKVEIRLFDLAGTALGAAA
ncbi:cobalt-precorrin-5B (C(1))-methyltransferase CbiD [Actimicrobium sp. CCC2.4]|uniref:cobalt-precorrin-5B (C(1))-methyltransferase CbiD n=1 Tax=Actimicrobium sp. CCC2.4 TaxID=3048606 RepID=UPI002AC98175|nr:cobalt-precorrin-5B (C(1))-methyltransferase CbiD [Actimicrobium sp. CCC2.4]MEB0136834.1 cobalt-precorrin-5B (C(1))-methyltransferase CbiD [Actimicrobium sp. CCC2.4]WPX33890.1 cobalt-precorrin-5B (C(1))-methyltransferase CbiD [Actimicrobium sp. CCC2.4]